MRLVFMLALALVGVTGSFLQTYERTDVCKYGIIDTFMDRGCMCSSPAWTGKRCDVIGECNDPSLLKGYCFGEETSARIPDAWETSHDALCVIATVLSCLSLFAVSIQATKQNYVMKHLWKVLCIRKENVSFIEDVELR